MVNQPSDPLETIVFLESIATNSRLNKRQHFYAGERNQFYNNIFGSSAVIINVMLGSVLFITVTNTIPDFAKWLSGFMAMIAAVCSGIQTFFNFHKQSQGHRRIANRYLEVQRECEYLLAKYKDNPIEIELLQEKVERLTDKYNTINNDAEDFPTEDQDFARAKKSLKARK